MPERPLLGRLRRRGGADLPTPNGAAPLAPTTPPGVLRRERRALRRVREERIRDVGGLAVEMVRRNRFRYELLIERCNEVLAVENRIHAIDDMLSHAPAARRLRTARCECGAPLQWGSHFCGNCGRPTGVAVVTCARCNSPLPADARYCSNCGSIAAETARAENVAASYEDTAHGDAFWRGAPGDGSRWQP